MLDACSGQGPGCLNPGRQISVWPLLLALLLCVYATQAGACEPLLIQGDKTECACSQNGWAGLESQLGKLPGVASPQELSSLVRGFLCDSGPRSTRALHRSTPQLIASQVWGKRQDSTPQRRLRRSEIAPRAGQAWDASVKKDDERVLLTFAPNAACVTGVAFVHQTSGWLLVGVEDACD